MGGGRRRQAGRRAAKQANNCVPPSPSTQLGASGSVQRSCCQLLHDPWIAMQPPKAWAIHGQRNTTHGADSVSPTCSCRPLCKIRDDCYLETVPTDAPCRPVLSVTQTTFKSSHSHISLQQHYDTGHHPLHYLGGRKTRCCCRIHTTTSYIQSVPEEEDCVRCHRVGL